MAPPILLLPGGTERACARTVDYDLRRGRQDVQCHCNALTFKRITCDVRTRNSLLHSQDVLEQIPGGTITSPRMTMPLLGQP
ncbi:hypothetical protein ARMSODRAFT_518161 [Armillaria solidipes]|uniref:Uncharacterized protein n=1 Tax=Armillaria solidipes TaxID=1076256 RepID=A0A2H3AZI0_9AGAR|nr:hypothetical protein ARMSODRAFT_518161 [Armillaria solidipes]